MLLRGGRSKPARAAPMGASYCTEGNGSATSHGGPSGDPYTCGPWSDTSTAAANHRAHATFFRDAFPEFEASQQPVSLTGESYAGTYIPMLMDQILTRKQVPNFRGAAIGNGCWGSDCFYGMTEPQIDYHIFEGHALIPQSLKSQIELACTDFNDPSAECERLLDKSQRLPGAFNVYNIYDLCNGDDMAQRGLMEAYRPETFLRCAESPL